MPWLEPAQAEFEQMGDRLGLTRALDYLSRAYQKSGDTTRALQYAEQHLRIAAARLYQQLYAKTPNVEFRSRCTELTATQLSPPPPLPALPSVVTGASVNLPELLATVRVPSDAAALPHTPMPAA